MNLDPECGSFSNGSELGRLIVREAESRHALVLACEVSES